MTPEELIAEGRRLQRKCVYLRAKGSGPVAAVWYEYDRSEIDRTGFRCWLTVDARYIPGLRESLDGYLTIFTDEKNCEGGRVEVSTSLPNRKGTPLYAHHADVLPPVNAVFLRGSEAVGAWLKSCNWDRRDSYTDGFPGKSVVEKYESLWMDEFPLYQSSDIYACLGGWQMPWPDDDWLELVDEQLMVFTVKDAEPWVEAWRMRDGSFKVFQRNT